MPQKTEARKLIAQIASGRAYEEPMTLAEVEDYRLAQGRLVPFGVSLLGAQYRDCQTEFASVLWLLGRWVRMSSFPLGLCK